jgi:threonine dehydrogenase-like Zn-dependent dehydrogenase
MRQLTMTADRDVEWWEVPEPALQGDREALVRPLAVALCDIDRPILRGIAPIPGPIAIGHEGVAEVVDVGDAVRTVSPGDRVVVPFQISCGECDRCRRAQTGDCRRVAARSMYGFGVFGGDWGGLLSDLARVPFADAMLVPVPDAIEPAVIASASDNIPDGWRTVAPHLDVRPGAEVLVVGGGAPSVGLYAVDAALALGAGRVVYADDDEGRLSIAAQLGAETVDGRSAESYGEFAITVDASASHAGLHGALRSTEPGGVCTSTGIYYEQTTPMPLLEMFTNGITFITGRAMARPAIPAILEGVAAGKLRPERVTSGVAAWDDAAEAVGEAHTKLVVER